MQRFGMAPDADLQHLEVLDKANAILTALEHGERSANEVSEQINEPISTTYRLIRTLLSLDWISHGSARGLYRVGLQAMAAGSAFVDTLDVRELLSPLLLHIRDTTLLTSYLCLPSGTHGVCIERHAGHGVRLLALTVGGSMPMSSGSGPAAMLAAMPPQDADEIMDQLGVRGDQRTTLKQRLAGYHERGYIVSDGDATRGVASFGAPIFDHEGRVAGSVSAGGLRDSVIGNARLADLIIETSRYGSELLGWKGTDGQAH